MNHVRRYVFVTYEDLLQIRFKKLERVSDKVYVFIGKTIELVPLWLVKQMQEMGRDVQWVSLEDVGENAAAAVLSFHMGVLHERVEKSVEFAVFSDDERYDSLVAHLGGLGRQCIRVKQGRAGSPEEPDKVRLDQPGRPSINPPGVQQGATSPETGDVEVLEASAAARLAVAPLADELVRRLIRSGNRPGQLPLLRSYIELHREGDRVEHEAEEIIDHLVHQGEIRVEGMEVEYNF